MFVVAEFDSNTVGSSDQHFILPKRKAMQKTHIKMACDN